MNIFKTFRILVCVIFAALIGAGFGSRYAIKKFERKASLTFVNSMLYDLKIEIDLLTYWKNVYYDDTELEDLIKHLVFNKIIVMATLKPNINDLQGVPIDALAGLIKAKNENLLAGKDYENRPPATLNYLVTIEKDVNKILSERKRKHKQIFKEGKFKFHPGTDKGA